MPPSSYWMGVGGLVGGLTLMSCSGQNYHFSPYEVEVNPQPFCTVNQPSLTITKAEETCFHEPGGLEPALSGLSCFGSLKVGGMCVHSAYTNLRMNIETKFCLPPWVRLVYSQYEVELTLMGTNGDSISLGKRRCSNSRYEFPRGPVPDAHQLPPGVCSLEETSLPDYITAGSYTLIAKASLTLDFGGRLTLSNIDAGKAVEIQPRPQACQKKP